MKKFSQLNRTKRIFEQEDATTQTGTSQAASDSTVKVQINAQNSQEDTTSTTQENPKEHVIKFFSKIFESREMAHVYHLTVKGEEGSHAKHLALNTYYDEIIDLLDQIIEVYQGEYEVVEGYEVIDTSATKSLDTIKYFQDLAEFIKKERKVCFKEDDTQYFNIIDDMLVLIYRTLYKLKYNK